jgi:hypothetical protein
LKFIGDSVILEVFGGIGRVLGKWIMEMFLGVFF